MVVCRWPRVQVVFRWRKVGGYSSPKVLQQLVNCSNSQTYSGTSLTFRGEKWTDSYDIQWHTASRYIVTNKIRYKSDGTTHPIYAAKSWSSQVIGEYVCEYGKTTHRGCGTISSKDFNPRTPRIMKRLLSGLPARQVGVILVNQKIVEVPGSGEPLRMEQWNAILNQAMMLAIWQSTIWSQDLALLWWHFNNAVLQWSSDYKDEGVYNFSLILYFYNY